MGDMKPNMHFVDVVDVNATLNLQMVSLKPDEVERNYLGKVAIRAIVALSLHALDPSIGERFRGMLCVMGRVWEV